MKARPSGCSQGELVPRSRKPMIPIDPNHRIVKMADMLDWTTLEAEFEKLRRSKVGPAGRRPHMRALLGAMVFMAIQRMTYRQAEDLIRYYAPARYLCGLTETDWTPDFTTLQDFASMIGEEGMTLLNEHIVRSAAELGLADTSIAVADMTAQEALIPYPNEMGLMSRFFLSMGKACVKAGGALKNCWIKLTKKVKKAKKKVRKYRLLAKTQEMRHKLTTEVSGIVGQVQKELDVAVDSALKSANRLKGWQKAAFRKASELHQTMGQLLPQIRSWLKTGKVAKGKIVNLHMPQVGAIVRGKVGKAVEFGWRWGILRMGGGFLLGRASQTLSEMNDSKFTLDAVKIQRRVLGKVPKRYAYDRGGYSPGNAQALGEMGVDEIGLAPRGRGKWYVDGQKRENLIRERAKVEGSIGAIKSGRYGFNRPGARSVSMMKFCGQRALVGFNLNKLVMKMAEREGLAVTG